MKDIPMMERSIALCNGVSQWVQLMVLSRPTSQLRAEVFTKFIQVAQVLPQCCTFLSSAISVILHNLTSLSISIGGRTLSLASLSKDDFLATMRMDNKMYCNWIEHPDLSEGIGTWHMLYCEMCCGGRNICCTLHNTHSKWAANDCQEQRDMLSVHQRHSETETVGLEN